MKKSQATIVEEVLIANGSSTNNQIADRTYLSTQQVATGLNGLKEAGKVTKELVQGGPAVWHLTGPLNRPLKVKVKTATESIMPGDLFEVAGQKVDGTIVVRTLEAPNTMYTIQEV